MSKVYAIQCTNCGGSLKIRGGGRVTTVTCEYCNSVLEMTEHYTVLSKFHDKYRPIVPFTLGMVGTIKNIEWTIIGWVSYKTTEFPIDRWSEFFLYSPLYGYGWLIYENGILSFSKRVRDFSLSKWQKNKTNKMQFFRKSHYTLAENPYNIEIDFVQGELTWVAKANDTIRCWDYNGPNHKSLTVEKSANELESYQNEKLNNKEIYKSFGVKVEDQVEEKLGTIDKLFKEDTLEASDKSRKSFIVRMAILIAIILSTIGYSFVASKSLFEIDTNQAFSQLIEVDSSSFLSKIVIKAPTPEILDTVKLGIYNKNTSVLTIDRDTLYSINGNIGKTWNNGDDEISIYVKLKAGEYRVRLAMSKPLIYNTVKVVIEEKVARLQYLLIVLALLFMSIVLSYKPNSSAGMLLDKTKYLWLLLASIIGFKIFGFVILFIIGAFYIVATYGNDKDRSLSDSFVSSKNDSTWYSSSNDSLWDNDYD